MQRINILPVFLSTYKSYLVTIFLIFSYTCSYGQDIEVAPARINFNAQPGEGQTRTVTVKNHGNKKETITLRMYDFLVNREGEIETLPAGSTRNSISNWVNLNPTFLELQPSQSGTVQINLQSSSEDYSAKWGILSFTSTVEQTAFTADQEVQTGLSLMGRIDIYLNYNPLTMEAHRLEINRLQEVESTQPGERMFTVNIENTGEQITNAKVFLIASQLETAEEHRFKTTEINVYPQSIRTVLLSFPEDELPTGEYSLAAIIDYAGSTSLKGTQIIIDVE
ncbi:MAG: hypothetical protein ACOC2E_03685 [Bacteroidota bacterium]